MRNGRARSRGRAARWSSRSANGGARIPGNGPARSVTSGAPHGTSSPTGRASPRSWIGRAVCIRHDETGDVWVRELAGGDLAIALLNLGEAAREIHVGLDDLAPGPKAHVRIRDLWQRADVAGSRDDVSAHVRPHSATVLRIARY